MKDVETLARTLYGEAVPFDTQDAEAIASVVLNRVGWRNWPNTISEVCLQPWQFSCWNQNDPNRRRILAVDQGENTWFDRCWDIADRAEAGEIQDRTRGSTHYHTPEVRPAWSRGKQPVFETAGHRYFNNIDTAAPRTEKESLDQDRPLKESRTARGGVVAGAATIAGVLWEKSGEAIEGAVQSVQPLSAYFDAGTIQVLITGIALGGIGYMLYARIDDRRNGRR